MHRRPHTSNACPRTDSYVEKASTAWFSIHANPTLNAFTLTSWERVLGGRCGWRSAACTRTGGHTRRRTATPREADEVRVRAVGEAQVQGRCREDRARVSDEAHGAAQEQQRRAHSNTRPAQQNMHKFILSIIYIHTQRTTHTHTHTHTTYHTTGSVKSRCILQQPNYEGAHIRR